MIKVLLFLLFSSLEWMALIMLALAMFRFPLRGNVGQVVFTSFLLSLLSYFVFRTMEINALATVLQPPAVFLFFWQMFRIHYFYAAIVTIYGYLGFAVLQLCVYFAFDLSGIAFSEIVPNTFAGYLLQVVSVSLICGIALLLYKYRIGYSFVPDYAYKKVVLRGLNLRILLLVLAGYIVISFSNLLFFSIGFATLTFVSLAAVLGILLYLALKKDGSDRRPGHRGQGYGRNG
ncbi:hypothetical protein [Paenibacillus sp. GYB003]|uniref:hypothetical protein n=1 Tax=Paenibacillus sp. GYB003 TaxID=2994392 RepID=UPI002F96D97D